MASTDPAAVAARELGDVSAEVARRILDDSYDRH
jgi:hypothetical protein